MMMGSIFQEDIAIINMYVQNNRASNYIRQKCRTTKINRCTHYNSWRLQKPSIKNGQIQWQKISKDGVVFNTINELDIRYQ